MKIKIKLRLCLKFANSNFLIYIIYYKNKFEYDNNKKNFFVSKK
jgi:hypothetical protein